MDIVPNRSPAAELEALLRLVSARDVLDHALLGGPWLDAMVVNQLARLVEAGARWLAVAAAERSQ